MGSSAAPTPPTAPRKDHVQTWHGQRFTDPYYWLRQKGSPDVESYLKAENAYTEAVTAELEPFAKALYAEMLGRIRQTDLGVPTRRGAFYYYSRTVEGLQYPIRCRKPAAADGSFEAGAAEEVVLDQNEMAKGLKFLSIGEFEVSDDGRRLLYSTDTTGFRQYSLFVKDLATGSGAGSARRAGDERLVGGGRRDGLLRDRAPGDQALGHAVAAAARGLAREAPRGDGRAVLDRRGAHEGQEVRGARQPLDRHLGPVDAAGRPAERNVRGRAPAREGPQVRRRAPRRHALHPHEQGREELQARRGAARRPVAGALEDARRGTGPTSSSTRWSCSATTW